MHVASRSYLHLNLIGSAILTGVGLNGRDWGFFLLEGVWALVSVWGLVTPGHRGHRLSSSAHRRPRLASRG
jgi:hypothetical protein